MRPDSDSVFRALDAPDIALELLVDGIHLHPDAGAIALFEDRIARRGVIFPFLGAEPDDALVLLHEKLVDALGDADGCRLVLASVRPDGDDTIAEADLATWRAILGRHEGRRLELLDWFVITRRCALSMSTLSGRPVEW